MMARIQLTIVTLIASSVCGYEISRQNYNLTNNQTEQQSIRPVQRKFKLLPILQWPPQLPSNHTYEPHLTEQLEEKPQSQLCGKPQHRPYSPAMEFDNHNNSETTKTHGLTNSSLPLLEIFQQIPQSPQLRYAQAQRQPYKPPLPILIENLSVVQRPSRWLGFQSKVQ